METKQYVSQVIDRQKNFYFTGATKPLPFRIEMLSRLKDAIQSRENEIYDALYKDLKKPEFESFVTEVGFVLSSISHMIKNLPDWMEPETAKTPIHLQPAKSYVVKEPYGSVLIIGPFNYPFQLLIEPLIGALAAGNCAVVKPSEDAPHTAAVIRSILESIFPREYVTVIEGERETVSALIHAPFDYIFFTGSVAVGKIVMKAAAERLTPLTLELGGKSPAIIDQTADLKKAAERIAWGKFVNTGQTCVAPDYVMVHESAEKEFVTELIRAIKAFYGKEPQKSPDYGRIINEKQFDRLYGLLQKEKEHIHYGGAADRNDLYIAPTVLTGISFDHPIMEDEIFGPLLPVMTYRNLGEAIHDIRKRPKPLSAYLFTENEQAADYFTENLPFGGGCINDTISHVGNIHLPFGGVGPSGMNAYHGRKSFDTFSHEKAMMHKNTKIPMRAAFPPYKNKLKIVKPLIR